MHQLADHFLEAGDFDKAVKYAVIAAERSARLYANDEAISHYSHAIALTRKAGDSSGQLAALLSPADAASTMNSGGRSIIARAQLQALGRVSPIELWISRRWDASCYDSCRGLCVRSLSDGETALSESKKRRGFATRAIHSGEGPDPVTGAHNPPIYQSSTFAFSSLERKQQVQSGEREGWSYTRHGNPTTSMIEKKIADLEEAETALAGASGMAVISAALFSQLKSGDHVVAADDLYTWANVWMEEEAPNYGIEVTRVRITDLDDVRSAIRPNTKVLYAELMSNPKIVVSDVPALATIARENGLIFIVDNTFASPYLFRPLEHGAHLSLHSATKYISGHGDALAGIISGSRELIAPIKRQTEVLGSCISPFNSWLLLRGMKTLDMRMERHCQNAMQLARYLAEHPEVSHVNYAGLEDHPGHELATRLLGDRYGGMLSFSMRSGPDARDVFADSLELCFHAVSLGDVSTLVWPHRDELVRVSVGCENIEDIIADFDQAFERVKSKSAVPAD